MIRAQPVLQRGGGPDGLLTQPGGISAELRAGAGGAGHGCEIVPGRLTDLGFDAAGKPQL